MNDEVYDKFSFDKEKGLFFEGKFLINANISVIEKNTLFAPEMEQEEIRYRILVEYTNHRPAIKKWVCDLRKIELWDFEINDSLLDKGKRKLIQYKLFHEVEMIENKIIVKVYSGLQNIFEESVYVIGEHVILKQNSKMPKVEFECNFRISTNQYAIETERRMCYSYINLFPGVSEIMFYGSLYAVIKPFLEHLNINGGFVIALVGPPGHLKTSLVRDYALWLCTKEMQEIGFYYSQKNQVILENISILKGQNYLLDDLRRVESRTENIRQQQRLDIVSRHVNMTGKCANVFVTGESLTDMGIFSCIDRILQIRIPRMNDSEIIMLKNKLSLLDTKLMPTVALHFVERLMNNFEQVLEDVQNYYNENVAKSEIVEGCSTRTQRYGMFLKLTEFLFRKYYILGENYEMGEKDSLQVALDKQFKIQQLELQKMSINEDKPDYIADFYEMVNKSGKIKTINDPRCYTADETSCLINNGKIYITSAALKRLLFTFYDRYVQPKVVIEQFHSEGILEEELKSKGLQKNYKQKKHYVINIALLVRYMVCNGYEVSKEMQRQYYPNL